MPFHHPICSCMSGGFASKEKKSDADAQDFFGLLSDGELKVRDHAGQKEA